MVVIREEAAGAGWFDQVFITCGPYDGGRPKTQEPVASLRPYSME